MRAQIAMVNNDTPSLLHFSNFSEDFKQTNCGVPLRIDSPRGECRIRWNQERSVLKYSIFDSCVMFFVWIAPTQFVKSSNLSQMVDVADKDALNSGGPSR